MSALPSSTNTALEVDHSAVDSPSIPLALGLSGQNTCIWAQSFGGDVGESSSESAASSRPKSGEKSFEEAPGAPPHASYSVRDTVDRW